MREERERRLGEEVFLRFFCPILSMATYLFFISAPKVCKGQPDDNLVPRAFSLKVGGAGKGKALGTRLTR